MVSKKVVLWKMLGSLRPLKPCCHATISCRSLLSPLVRDSIGMSELTRGTTSDTPKNLLLKTQKTLLKSSELEAYMIQAFIKIRHFFNMGIGYVLVKI